MPVDDFFSKICKKFNEKGVKYLVCGAYASILHGIERISGNIRKTTDYDFIVDSSKENVRRIKSALIEEIKEVRDLKEDDLERHETVLIVDEKQRSIDLISKLWGLDYSTAIKRAVFKEVKGIKIPVICIDDLIKTKLKSFRIKDKYDVYWLKKLKTLNRER